MIVELDRKSFLNCKTLHSILQQQKRLKTHLIKGDGGVFPNDLITPHPEQQDTISMLQVKGASNQWTASKAQQIIVSSPFSVRAGVCSVWPFGEDQICFIQSEHFTLLQNLIVFLMMRSKIKETNRSLLLLPLSYLIVCPLNCSLFTYSIHWKAGFCHLTYLRPSQKEKESQSVWTAVSWFAILCSRLGNAGLWSYVAQKE